MKRHLGGHVADASTSPRWQFSSDRRQRGRRRWWWKREKRGGGAVQHWPASRAGRPGAVSGCPPRCARQRHIPSGALPLLPLTLPRTHHAGCRTPPWIRARKTRASRALAVPARTNRTARTRISTSSPLRSRLQLITTRLHCDFTFPHSPFLQRAGRGQTRHFNVQCATGERGPKD